LDVEERLRERILEYVKSYHARKGLVPSIGRVCKHLHTHYKAVKALFPGGAVDVYTQAGVPIPKEQIQKTERAMRKRMMKLARLEKARAEGKPPAPPNEKPRLDSAGLLRLFSLFDALVDSFFQALHALYTVEEGNSLVDSLRRYSVDEAARQLINRIGRVDPEYVRDLLERQDRDGYLAGREELGGFLNFDFRDEDLEELEAKQRHAWVELLKKYNPELLAEIISPSK